MDPSYRQQSIAAAVNQVAPEIRAKWRHAFDEFDQTKNGVITAGELQQIMVHNLRMCPAPGEVEAMIQAVDLNNDNAVSYDEFEMMMVSAGRGNHGGMTGFHNVVQRFIRMTDIAASIAQECSGFVDQFCMRHREQFFDLATPDVGLMEQQPVWFDTHKIFCEEAELMMQNALLLWGTAQMKSFDEDFLEAVSENGLLDNFLRYTNYANFIAKMYSVAQAMPGDQHPASLQAATRPETPCTHGSTQKKLAQLDRQLAMLDYQRNQLLAERRRLVGSEIQPITTGALKQELEMRRWREEVGND